MKRRILALTTAALLTSSLAACDLSLPGFLNAVGGSSAANVKVGGSSSADLANNVKNQLNGWQLKYEETFDKDLGVSSAPWVKDPLGKDSPYYVDEFSDTGAYYDGLGGEAANERIKAANIYRKSVTTGQNNWLRVEVAAQDLNNDGKPDADPTLRSENGDGVIDVPAWNSGVVLTADQPLPSEYRVEYELKTVDFGGKRERNGEWTWNYDGKYNGYKPGDCKTNFPWVRKGDYNQGGEGIDPCAKPFGDVTKENGYYLLSIMDYAHPAPHNNIFIHSHRKVGMDTYSVDAGWAKNYKVCNPKTRQVEEYTDTSANGINQIFFDGNSFRDPKFAYNQFVMPTPCGLKVGDDPNATIVATAELQPDLMPNQTYRFAIERHKDSYVTEITGNFRHIGYTTIRNERKFEEDGHSIWHYNQSEADGYTGQHNQTLTFEGPDGTFSKEMWPAGVNYPDNFVIGVPHLNYYEGSATIDNLRLYTRG